MKNCRVLFSYEIIAKKPAPEIDLARKESAIHSHFWCLLRHLSVTLVSKKQIYQVKGKWTGCKKKLCMLGLHWDFGCESRSSEFCLSALYLRSNLRHSNRKPCQPLDRAAGTGPDGDSYYIMFPKVTSLASFSFHANHFLRSCWSLVRGTIAKQFQGFAHCFRAKARIVTFLLVVASYQCELPNRAKSAR